MSQNASSESRSGRPLRILHCLRAPVGGLFRHVCDLAAGQAARGHAVGIICDATSGGSSAEAALATLKPACRLGITRLPIGRLPGLADLAAIAEVARIARAQKADILHGHGAKGGAYARLAPLLRRGHKAGRFYTPHGGSLHYSRDSAAGLAFLTAERVMMRRTSGMIFESAYGEAAFAAKVAPPSCAARVIHNGLREAEFAPVETAPGAADLVFIGELRALKGVSDLLAALALPRAGGGGPTAVIIGSGADGARFQSEAQALGLTGRVTFRPAMPARAGFALGRVLVVPSLAESLPYIVLEAAAAGRPVLATRVGGLGEIFGGDENLLVPPGDPAALAGAIAAALSDAGALETRAERLKERVHRLFNADDMCDRILEFYGQAMASGR